MIKIRAHINLGADMRLSVGVTVPMSFVDMNIDDQAEMVARLVNQKVKLTTYEVMEG